VSSIPEFIVCFWLFSSTPGIEPTSEHVGRPAQSNFPGIEPTSEHVGREKADLMGREKANIKDRPAQSNFPGIE
jgi:hypothetical protein